MPLSLFTSARGLVHLWRDIEKEPRPYAIASTCLFSAAATASFLGLLFPPALFWLLVAAVFALVPWLLAGGLLQSLTTTRAQNWTLYFFFLIAPVAPFAEIFYAVPFGGLLSSVGFSACAVICSKAARSYRKSDKQAELG